MSLYKILLLAINTMCSSNDSVQSKAVYKGLSKFGLIAKKEDSNPGTYSIYSDASGSDAFIGVFVINEDCQELQALKEIVLNNKNFLIDCLKSQNESSDIISPMNNNDTLVVEKAGILYNDLENQNRHVAIENYVVGEAIDLIASCQNENASMAKCGQEAIQPENYKTPVLLAGVPCVQKVENTIIDVSSKDEEDGPTLEDIKKVNKVLEQLIKKFSKAETFKIDQAGSVQSLDEDSETEVEEDKQNFLFPESLVSVKA